MSDPTYWDIYGRILCQKHRPSIDRWLGDDWQAVPIDLIRGRVQMSLKCGVCGMKRPLDDKSLDLAQASIDGAVKEVSRLQLRSDRAMTTAASAAVFSREANEDLNAALAEQDARCREYDEIKRAVMDPEKENEK